MEISLAIKSSFNWFHAIKVTNFTFMQAILILIDYWIDLGQLKYLASQSQLIIISRENKNTEKRIFQKLPLTDDIYSSKHSETVCDIVGVHFEQLLFVLYHLQSLCTGDIP